MPTVVIHFYAYYNTDKKNIIEVSFGRDPLKKQIEQILFAFDRLKAFVFRQEFQNFVNLFKQILKNPTC